MQRSGGLDPRELEAHRPWLRRLALAILRDAEQADDCVQDVFLTALARAPAPRASLRGWLARVLVNRARRALDRESLRRHHEAAALEERLRAGSAARADPLELRELYAELHASVLALAPRQRDAVRLRHGQGLTPRQIAERLRVPTKTVDSWLQRGHRELRRRLERRYGSAQGWQALAAALVRGEIRAGGAPDAATSASGPRPAQTGERPRAERPSRADRSPSHPRAGASRVVGPARWIGAAALASAGLVALRALAPEPLALAAPIAAALEDASPAQAVALAAPALPPPDARAPFRAAQEARPPPGAPELWRGRVVDAEGAPVGGVGLRFEPLTEQEVLLFGDRDGAGAGELLERVGHAFTPERAASASAVRARSAGDGTFALALPAGPGWLAVDDPAWATVTTAVALVRPPIGDALVRVAPARALAGRVLDARGAPLASARVELRLPERFLALGSCAPSSLPHEPGLFTDEEGRFALERVPDVPDARLRAHKSGYRPCERALADAPDGLVLALEALDAGSVLAGRALDAAGAPLAGAFVSLDWRATAISDAQGRFRLPLPPGPDGASEPRGTLRAAAQGWLPLERVLDGAPAAGELELVFDAPALAIAGLVLRADGTPHAHAAVWTPAPSLLGLPPDDRPPVFAEHVMAGLQPGGSFEATVTDADGLYVLRGLADRAYPLRVADLDTREWLECPPVRAGRDDVLLELPPEGCWPEVAGTVVDRRGAPLPEARVARTYPRLDAPLPDGRRWQTRFAGQPVEVDREGRFALTDVARRGGLLSVFGTGLVTRHVALDDLRDPRALTLVVGRSCRVVVERGALACDGFRFLSADGRPVAFQLARAGSAALDAGALAGERSGELLVADTAAELVWLDGARAVARVALELSPVDLNRLAP